MEEKEAVLRGLEMALKMEADGKKYYQKASLESSNEAGKKLFASLAMEEDEHARRFVEIFNHLKVKSSWPDNEITAASTANIRTLFAEALEEISAEDTDFDTELKAVETAKKMEEESISLYTDISSRAGSFTESSFFKAVIAEEREHLLVLNDYSEYLRDPAGWFMIKEHHSLDGA